jgi:hypothetical protein
MKKTLLAALAVAGIAASTGAQAQSTYTTGDSVLFFRSTAGTGAGSSLLINLGAIGTRGTDYNGTANFASINIDLSAGSSIVSQTFGTNWWNNANLRWGVIGSPWDNNANTDTFSYRLSAVASPVNLGIDQRVGLANDVDQATTLAFSQPSSTKGLINGTYAYGISANGYVLNSPTVEVVTDNGDGTFTTNQVAQDNFIAYNEGADIAAYDKGGFGGILNGPVSKDITLVTTQNLYAANNTLDRASGDFTSVGEPAQFGTVSVANGVVSVVPEPSTYALIGFGALLLIVAYRRANS